MIRRLRRQASRPSRGQAMVEMAMILPILLLLVLGMLEFGIAFDNNLTLEYATREGARTGSAMANGGGPLGCPGQPATAALVDPAIIEAVQRVITSRGSPVDVGEVSEIRIYRYKTDVSGNEIPPTEVNRWTNAVNPITGAFEGDFAVDGITKLAFRRDLAVQSWPVCSRVNGLNPDSVGVSLKYRYAFETPLGALLSMVQIDMRDHTVMALNPTNQ